MKTLQASKLQLAIGLPYDTDSSLKCYVHATLISDRDSSNNTGNKTITLIKVHFLTRKIYKLIFVMYLPLIFKSDQAQKEKN